jgi:hypothetical protein
MSLRHLLGLASLALVALGIAAAPASATSIQNASGQPYTGPFTGALSGNAVFTGSNGSVTCNVSTATGTITNAGSAGGPAAGRIDTIDWSHNSFSGGRCNDTVVIIGVADPVHSNNDALDLPWSGSADWINDNTSGNPNGTFTFSGFGVRLTFNVAGFGTVTCDLVGDFNNTGAGTREIQADLHNPDNGGQTKMIFEDEPLEVFMSDPNCGTTATFDATYLLFGSGLTDLQIRQSPPAAAGGQAAGAVAAVNPECEELRAKLKKAKTKKKKKKIRKKLKALGC